MPVNTPVVPVMEPPLIPIDIAATVSLKPAISKVPPFTVTSPVLAKTLLAPRLKVPALIVVPPV